LDRATERRQIKSFRQREVVHPNSTPVAQKSPSAPLQEEDEAVSDDDLKKAGDTK